MRAHTLSAFRRWHAPCLVLVILGSGCMGADMERPNLTLAEALLWDDYSIVRVRIDFVEGRAPTSLALDEMRRALQAVTGKALVDLQDPREIAGWTGNRERAWSLGDLYGFHDDRFGDLDHGNVVADAVFLHTIYVDGRLNGGTVAGLNTGNEIYLFPDSFREGAEGNLPLPGADRVERSVLIHETGHALGLVGCGVPMVRPHQGDLCHSSNEASVMYHNADGAVLDALLDAAQEGRHIHYEFDADDLADLRAFREAGRAR